MEELGVVYGSCLHGCALRVLGMLVVFVESCPTCADTLEGEGFHVRRCHVEMRAVSRLTVAACV